MPDKLSMLIADIERRMPNPDGTFAEVLEFLRELQRLRQEIRKLQNAVDDFFEPEPESVRQKTIDSIMEACRTGKKPKRIEMTLEEKELAEKNFAAFDRLKEMSRYAGKAALKSK